MLTIQAPGRPYINLPGALFRVRGDLFLQKFA